MLKRRNERQQQQNERLDQIRITIIDLPRVHGAGRTRVGGGARALAGARGR